MVKKTETKVPSDVHNALKSNARAKVKWDGLTPIARRDFLHWIGSAKQEETHKRRISRTCSMLVAGKRRPCCFNIVPMKLYTLLGANARAKQNWNALSAEEKRDFVDWIGSAKDNEENKRRIEKTSVMIAAGKKHP